MFCKIIIFNLMLIGSFFISANAHKIYFVEQSTFLDWNAANLACKKIGFDLLSIKTQDEFDYLKEYIKKEKGHILPFWLGAYRVNGKFVWASTFEKIQKFFWHKGEPNNKSGNENCIHTWERDFDWNDNDCELKLPYVCEKEV